MHNQDFLGGVVEGFYGRPWAHHQRLHLFRQMHSLGLNTYFYAPKDDLKHRALWRELYDDVELASFRELARASDEHGVQFIYGLSPGLDIRFAQRTELLGIRDRFEQLRKVGIHHFALLFDDLPGQLSEADVHAYRSLAEAQCDVANRVFDMLPADGGAGRFLFCPTPYCDQMDRQQLGGAGYLDEIGRLLHREIDVLWTGPEIVSREIAVESINRLSQRIGRPPVLWDNLFANDYDFHRLHCGPYSGRSRDLRGVVRGILINPNNEYPVNFIPLRSFARYLTGDGDWNSREVYLSAVAEWLGDFQTVRTPLPLDDLVLLADCFYLPHAEGAEAEKLLKIIPQLTAGRDASCERAYETFCDLNRRIQRAFECLTELRDRELFHAWSRYGWQLKEELLWFDTVLARRQGGCMSAQGTEYDLPLPRTFRGGLLAKLEQFLLGQVTSP